jgi:hypothetical protein
MADTQENEWAPGIVVLKDVALYEPGIERLGPPPGNAGVLIRGGAGWVFGVEAQPLARGIVKLDEPPPESAVTDALAREMAWRWFEGAYGSVEKALSSKNSTLRQHGPRFKYAEVESDFYERFLGLSAGTAIPRWRTLPESAVPPPERANVCACLRGTSCCASGCIACTEG